jgi:hypothetical protein
MQQPQQQLPYKNQMGLKYKSPAPGVVTLFMGIPVLDVRQTSYVRIRTAFARSQSDLGIITKI